MKSKMMSVITVAYNNLDDVRQELLSIEKYNDIDGELETIVVDHSDVSIIPDLENDFPNTIFLRHENKGFGSGNNYGARHSSGDILCFLNPDTYLIEPIFKEIIDAFEDKKVGIAGTQLLDKKLRKNFSFYYIDRNDFLSKQLIKRANNKSSFNPKTMYISGANLFIRRQLFFDIGLFDENMFMYYEEPDITKRMIAVGYTSLFRKDLHIVHLEGKKATASLSITKRKYQSAKYYCNKYNLDFRKILRQDYRYNIFKIMMLRFKNSSPIEDYYEKSL